MDQSSNSDEGNPSKHSHCHSVNYIELTFFSCSIDASAFQRSCWKVALHLNHQFCLEIRLDQQNVPVFIHFIFIPHTVSAIKDIRY